MDELHFVQGLTLALIMTINSAEFLASNTHVEKCPQPIFPEYAFIGRSNVGKSSLINMLTAHKGLAKTSATPGKTQLINHFLINKNRKKKTGTSLIYPSMVLQKFLKQKKQSGMR